MRRREPVSLADRIDALDRALAIGSEHLDPADVAAAHAAVEKARGRMGHGTDHTVIALAGSTGVGKSSLFNALIGDDVSTVGVRRPTTGVAHAAIWPPAGGGDRLPGGRDGEGVPDGDDDGEGLLDWLDIGRRHHVEADGKWGGLVLVDLPDFDSTEESNRAEVDRLVELVDAMIWVTDPQKYADEAFHHGYVRPLAGHGDVMRFVVNKIDTVAVDARKSVVTDLAKRLRADGIDDPKVRVTSIATGDGLDTVETMITATVDQRRAVVDRIEADLRTAAAPLVTSGTSDGVTKRARRELIERLGHAADVDQTGEIVAAQHRKDARMAMGWPPVRLAERFRRRHPISELPRATANSAARSEIDLALRDLAETVGAELAPSWTRVLRSTSAASADHLTSRLTTVTQEIARDATTRPSWWTPVAWLQRLVTLVAVVGAIWLLVVAVLGGFLQFDTDPLLIDTPGLEWIPLPSLLVLGGLAAGLLIALLVRIPVAAAARRRAAKVRTDLLARVRTVAEKTVIADVDRVLADRRAVLEQLAIVLAT